MKVVRMCSSDASHCAVATLPLPETRGDVLNASTLR